TERQAKSESSLTCNATSCAPADGMVWNGYAWVWPDDPSLGGGGGGSGGFGGYGTPAAPQLYGVRPVTEGGLLDYLEAYRSFPSEGYSRGGCVSCTILPDAPGPGGRTAFASLIPTYESPTQLNFRLEGYIAYSYVVADERIGDYRPAHAHCTVGIFTNNNG